MSTARPQLHQDAILSNVLLSALVIFVPFVGHLVLTVIILRDYLPAWQKVAWLAVTWIFWVIGPFLYLLLGQRRDRLFSWAWDSSHSATATPPPPQGYGYQQPYTPPAYPPYPPYAPPAPQNPNATTVPSQSPWPRD